MMMRRGRRLLASLCVPLLLLLVLSARVYLLPWLWPSRPADLLVHHAVESQATREDLRRIQVLLTAAVSPARGARNGDGDGGDDDDGLSISSTSSSSSPSSSFSLSSSSSSAAALYYLSPKQQEQQQQEQQQQQPPPHHNLQHQQQQQHRWLKANRPSMAVVAQQWNDLFLRYANDAMKAKTATTTMAATAMTTATIATTTATTTTVPARLLPKAPWNQSQRCSFVTVVAGNKYAIGAYVLGASLREHLHRGGSDNNGGEGAIRMTALVTSEDAQYRSLLENAGWEVQVVNPVSPPSSECYHNRRYRYAWTKLYAWQMTEYDRIVVVDSDAMVVGDMSELCYLTGDFYASEDVAKGVFKGSLFNTGVVSFAPSLAMYEELLSRRDDYCEYQLAQHKKVKGGDQAYLQWLFGDRWQRLPLGFNFYNTFGSTHADLLPSTDVRMIHYTTSAKPWDSLFAFLSSKALVRRRIVLMQLFAHGIWMIYTEQLMDADPDFRLFVQKAAADDVHFFDWLLRNQT